MASSEALTFGKNLFRLRTAKNISQRKLADMLFLSRQAVGHWESGIRMPDYPTLVRIAEILDVEIPRLFENTEDEDVPPNLLIVDDEPLILKSSVRMLQNTVPDAIVYGFQRSSETLLFADQNPVAAAFLDIELYVSNGLDLAKKLMELDSRMNIIFLTAYSEYARDALDLFCSGYIVKPLTPKKIREQLAHLRYPVRGLSPSYPL